MADEQEKDSTAPGNRLLATLTDPLFNQSVVNLVDIFTREGKSPEEIEAALNEFHEEDKVHLAEIAKQEEIIKAAQEKIDANDAVFLKLKQDEEKLAIEAAQLRTRIAERDAVLANLEQSIADRQKAEDDRQKKIDELTKNLGL